MFRFPKLNIIEMFLLSLFVAIGLGVVGGQPQPADAQSIFCILSCDQPSQYNPSSYDGSAEYYRDMRERAQRDYERSLNSPYRHSLRNGYSPPQAGAEYMYPTMELQLQSDMNKLLDNLQGRRCNSRSLAGC
ncbi:MAG: hypothetical protein OXI53_11825 [Nitrospira sp.]|nr:hypothetical protein [Nitrospira sp.]MDE0503040.1 hypothetical protein [Candidatus Poribacteria bacterium]